MKNMKLVRGHLSSTYTKFSKKLTFLTPWYAHVRVRIRGLEILVFRKILRTYLMETRYSDDFRLTWKKCTTPTLLATFFLKIQKTSFRWFLHVVAMTHVKYGSLNFFSANSKAKVQKSRKSEISGMSFSMDTHLMNLYSFWSFLSVLFHSARQSSLYQPK